MDSKMSIVHNQINRAISTAISERVIPEIQNIVSSMSSSGNKDTEASISTNSLENRENTSGLKSKLTKKDSRSACDLTDTTGRGTHSCKVKNSHCILSDQMKNERESMFFAVLALFSIAVRICTTQDLLTFKGTSPPYGKENS